MGKDDIKDESCSQTLPENTSRRHRERSFETQNSTITSYPKHSYRRLCVRKIPLKYDADTIEEHLRASFSPYGDVEIRIFRSSERKLAVIAFR